MVVVYWGRHIGADPVPGSGWVDNVGLLGAQGGRGRDDPVTGGEERGIEGGAEGVVLADPLVACNGGGEGRANGVDAFDMVEVRGVDGGDQHPQAHIAVADLCRRQPSHPKDFVGAGRGGRRGRLWWGTRSYVRERFFEPGLTAEEAAARIRQTAEGMRTLRPMLETMSWKYVLFYVRLKSKYLDLDLTTAMAGVPEARRPDYVRVANELVDNMTEFDRFVRTPKVYESYLYYEKTLKSLDDVTEFLA
uniref:Uncharacterized protein n=1 Tax=Oryza barthii TaxID=65489 RepID=A0A0D3F6U7_9ORYZ